MGTKFEIFEELIFLNTVLIENLTDKELGTGFLVYKKVDDSQGKYLLFSNKHVFWGKKDAKKPGIKKQIKITLHKMNERGEYEIGQTHHFTGELDRNGAGYFDHPDINVDVACANISGLSNMNVKLNIKGLDMDLFCNFDMKNIYAGMKIIFLGYPSGFYDRKNFLPIMRSGTIASLPSVDFNGNRQILLDAQIFPGSSGSPVFVLLNDKYFLLGVVSEGVAKLADLVELEVANETDDENEVKKVKLPREWIGLGMLFSRDTLKEVYDLA